MSKLWGGRFDGVTDKEVEAFTHSLHVDWRLWDADLDGSKAHATMLGKSGILTIEESAILVSTIDRLKKLLQSEISSGKNPFKGDFEDIHTFLETKIRELAGPVAGKLHTARSRNDQVATAFRLFVSRSMNEIKADILQLQKTILDLSNENLTTILPGMTHLQHAQPVSLAHHLMAYFWMLKRDVERIEESEQRLLSLPLGSAALAGTSFSLDRKSVADELGFFEVAPNSLDAVSDRDFVIESLSQLSLVMMHLSRLCEELILWSTPEFGFVELGDSVTTGSSIMPQKKNPDVAELTRGRTGKVFGHLMHMLTMMKGLPISYNRDMQEDKEAFFQSFDVSKASVRLMNKSLESAQFNASRMLMALKGDFSNATDLADDLAKKGIPFREAHEIVGRVVRFCIESKVVLEEISLEQLRGIDSRFDLKSLEILPHMAVLNARTSEGGTSPVRVKEQLMKAGQWLRSNPSASLADPPSF